MTYFSRLKSKFFSCKILVSMSLLDQASSDLKTSRLVLHKLSESFESIQSHVFSIIALSEQWQTFQKSSAMVQASLGSHIKELESKQLEIDSKQNLVDNREKEVDLRQKRLSSEEYMMNERCRALELREKQIRDWSEVLELEKKRIDEHCRVIELEENRICKLFVEMKKREKEIDDEHCKAQDLRDEQLNVRSESEVLDLQEKKQIDRFQALELKERQIDERCKGLKSREEQLDERSQGLELKEKRINGRLQEMESKEKHINEAYLEMELKEKLMSEKCQVLEFAKKQIDKSSKELELKEKQLNEGRKALESREKETNERYKGLELKESEINDRCKTFGRFKAESCSDLRFDDGIESASIRFCVTMDGKTLQMFLNEWINDHESIGEEVSKALKLSNNPPKLVLAALDGFFPPHLKKGNMVYEASVVKSSCVLLLEQLMNIRPRIDKALRKEARNVASMWKERMKEEGESHFVVLGFLLLVVTYRLVSSFDKDELKRLLKMVDNHRIAPQLHQRFEESEVHVGMKRSASPSISTPVPPQQEKHTMIRAAQPPVSPNSPLINPTNTIMPSMPNYPPYQNLIPQPQLGPYFSGHPFHGRPNGHPAWPYGPFPSPNGPSPWFGIPGLSYGASPYLINGGFGATAQNHPCSTNESLAPQPRQANQKRMQDMKKVSKVDAPAK